MRGILCCLLAFIGIVPPTYAQRQADIGKLASNLDSALVALETTDSNINDMALGVPESEFLPVSGAQRQIERTTAHYRAAWKDAEIASVMVDSRDYRRLLQVLKLTCRNAKKSGENTVQIINKTLVRVTSSALIAELSKARDLIQSLQGAPLCA